MPASMNDTPNDQQWMTISVTVPREIGDPIANFLHELAVPGLILDEKDPDVTRITAHVEKRKLRSVSSKLNNYAIALHELFPGLKEPVIKMAPLKSEKWATAWKDNFKPIKIGRKLVVTPPWIQPKTQDRQVVIIEPAEAFGTGGHETTQGCLALLEEAIEHLSQELQAVSHLDVGCGSGILAIAGAKLGATSVRAVDNDPVAIRSARSNAELNGLEDQLLLEDRSLDELVEPMDVVTANLDPITLTESRDKLVSLFSRYLIISGVPLNRWEDTKSEFVVGGSFLKREITRSEWGCGLFEKSGKKQIIS
jgi:ribosomal protein L11 methyltransferase